MLEFVRELFVRMPPNTTSWCETLEAFLGKQSYKLKTRVRLFITISQILSNLFKLENFAAALWQCPPVVLFIG
jgi:hypothetical protein